MGHARTDMTNTTETRFRLSIWRPARLDGIYVHASGSTGTTERLAVLDVSTVHEQIYSWDPGSYDLALNSTPEVAERINSDLLVPFGESQPPAQRSVPRFRKAVSVLLEAPEVSAGTYWSDGEETLLEGDVEVNLRVNAALGILRHLRWIAQVYADVPGASVLIR